MRYFVELMGGMILEQKPTFASSKAKKVWPPVLCSCSSLVPCSCSLPSGLFAKKEERMEERRQQVSRQRKEGSENFQEKQEKTQTNKLVEICILGGGFKYVLFSPLLGEGFQFD